MLIETALQLASENPGEKSLHAQMRLANEIHAANSDSWQRPFAPADIAFAMFVDHMRETATQRERDLVLISDRLYSVWTTLHTSAQVGERLSPAEGLDLGLLAAALKRQGLLHLLTEGLRPDMAEQVAAAAEE